MRDEQPACDHRRQAHDRADRQVDIAADDDDHLTHRDNDPERNRQRDAARVARGEELRLLQICDQRCDDDE